MPLVEGTAKYHLVYRPPGTPYGEGTGFAWNMEGIAEAIMLAREAFVKEFNRVPDPSRVVFEVDCPQSKPRAIMYEVPEEQPTKHAETIRNRLMKRE